MQNNAQLVSGRGQGPHYERVEKINFCFNYKADKTLRSGEHSRNGGVLQPPKRAELLSGHTPTHPTHTPTPTRLVTEKESAKKEGQLD